MAYIGRDISNLSDRVVLDNITASATATYNLLLNSVAFVPSSAESLTVSLNGVIQKPQSSYTVSGSTIVFASALTSSDVIDFILAERAITLTTVGSGSVGTSQLVDGSVSNAKLENSSITLNGSAVSLGGSATVGGNNTPYFFGQKASDQTITRRTETVVTGFTSNELDSNSAFDGTTFTVPSGEAGLYYFFANIFTDYSGVGADGEWTQIKFKKNNTTSGMPRTTVQRPNDGLYNLLTVNQSIIQNLSVGDTMEITAYTSDFNASGNATVSSENSFFMGYKLIGA